MVLHAVVASGYHGMYLPFSFEPIIAHLFPS